MFSGFYGFPIGREIFLQDPVLSKIDKKYKILHGAFLKVNSNSAYHWHIDRKRGASINMLMTYESLSFALFYKNKDDYITDKQQFETVKLAYEPNHFFLFNTQQYHSLINFDAPRVIFSCLFEEEKDDLTYEMVKDYCIEINLAKESNV
tara:strand:+ start:4342 stop:4788 length:447 start_codon:yes stop_codon:yes gene_type:complete